jgi:class 3 adenylate cyclase
MARQQTIDDALARAREAVARRSWREAYDLLSSADASGDLRPEDLELLAEAASWAGPTERCINAHERAYTAYREQGDKRSAARLALELFRDHTRAGAGSVAAGWLRRAERLLEDEPDCLEHGYLAYRHARAAWGQGDLERAREDAQRAVELSRRFGDQDLEALALQWQGYVLLEAGQLEEGWALIEEATAGAIAGELRPNAAGTVYCGTICACWDVADVQRAAEWTERFNRWCARTELPGGWPSDCQVHRAQVLRLRGDWSDAEREAKLACAQFLQFNLHGPAMAEAFGEVGEIRLRLGDLAGAEEAFRQAHEHGWEPQPGRALLKLAQGEVQAALKSIERALADESLERLQRAYLLPARVEIGLAAADIEGARSAADELEAIASDCGSSALLASALVTRGALQLSEGQTTAAAGSLRRGCRLWQEVGAPYEAARARVLLAEAYRAEGDEGAAEFELQAGQSSFERLGALLDTRHVAGLLADLVDAEEVRLARTFLFTDVCGSTALLEAVGDEAWRDLIAWHDRTLRALFAEHRGEEVDHAGDGFFVAFPEPVAAVECARSVQRALAEHRRAHGFAPSVRIGVHASEATPAGRGYRGKGVHEAARIAALAGAGEIVASRDTADVAGAVWSEERSVELKGISEAVDIVTVRWR